MQINCNVGIIGLGNMGGAIALALSENIPASNISVYDTDPVRTEQIKTSTGLIPSQFIEELIESSRIIILAVKPGHFNELLLKLREHKGIIVSVAAGLSIEFIKRIAGIDKKVIRAMPNTPVLSGAGMTVISPCENITDEDLENIIELFGYTGKVVVMPETLMDAVTGVSGSGPAYVFTFIQAMADGAVKMGIPRKEALQLAGQTVYGAAKMFLDKNENPLQLRDNVASPGGTTIEAIHVLEKAGFSGIIIDAIEAAVLKSMELGKK